MVERYESNLRGVAELDRRLAKLVGSVENKYLQRAANAGARETRDKARAAAKSAAWRNVVPLDDNTNPSRRSPQSKKYGRLARNIRIATLKKARRLKGRRASVATIGRSFWGYFLEFGTRRQPARPWFRPAFHASTNDALRAMRSSLIKSLDNHFRGK